MAGEGIQLQVVAHERVEAVETEPHIARTQAQIDAHAGGQVNHRRSVSSTTRSVAASTPVATRRRSPLLSITSRPGTRVAISSLGSSNVNRTGWLCRSRFRQR